MTAGWDYGDAAARCCANILEDGPMRASSGEGRLRVLYCTDVYPPQVSGISVVTSLSVAGLRQRGWECAVIAPRCPRGTFDPFPPSRYHGAGDRVSIPSVTLPGNGDARVAAPAYWSIARAIRTFRPDLVHCATESVIGRLGQVAAERAGVPLVSLCHTGLRTTEAADGPGRPSGAVSSYIARFHRRSSRTFTPSASARDHLISLGVPDVEVWGCGVDGDAFHPRHRSRSARAAFDFGERFVFLHVGRLAPEKGVDRILRAFALARGLLPARSIHLVVAGAGPAEPALRAAAPEDVTFLGNIERGTVLPSLYANCDAFVVSSLAETLGLGVLEAMASGLPVIATPVGRIADQLRDGANGLGYPAGATGAMAGAMVELARRKELRRHLAEGARRTAEAFPCGPEIDRLDASLREVCARAASARRAATRPADPKPAPAAPPAGRRPVGDVGVEPTW